MKRWIFADLKNSFFKSLFWGLGSCVHEIWCFADLVNHYSTVQHISFHFLLLSMSYNYNTLILLPWGLSDCKFSGHSFQSPSEHSNLHPKFPGAVGRIQGEAFPGGTNNREKSTAKQTNGKTNGTRWKMPCWKASSWDGKPSRRTTTFDVGNKNSSSWGGKGEGWIIYWYWVSFHVYDMDVHVSVIFFLSELP